MVSVVRFYWAHGPLNCDHQCKYVLCTDINIVNSGQMKLATFAPNVTCRAENETSGRLKFYNDENAPTGCPVKLFPLGYLLFCRLLLMEIAKVRTFLKNSRNLLQDRHKNFEN